MSPETVKLRDLVDRLDGMQKWTQPVGGGTTQYRAELQQLLIRVQAQSVLALEEQIGAYQEHVNHAMVVQCKVCHGSGTTLRPARDPGRIGTSLEPLPQAPCAGCGGSGLVRV